MNKEQAKNIIINTFENPFDKNNFTRFLKNLLKSFEEKTFSYQGNLIPDAFDKFISSYERIGRYEKGNEKIDLLIVYLKKETSLERARTTQRNFIGGYLKGEYGTDTLKDAALVAFVSPKEEDWRFSLVKIEYEFDNEGKVRERLSRRSFLVGKNEKSHTAQSKFVPILENDDLKPTLEDLEQAFNIEPVTKEFFEKYRELLIRTVSALDELIEKDQKVKRDFESKNITTIDFAKKLLGQIVFLYFLQKKGWFGVERDADWETGPKDFLRKLFNKEYGDYKNFFNDILEPLFYEALNRERDDNFYSRFNCKIPFLNGGLFEPIGNYDWVHTDIHLPNELFSNTCRTLEGDIGNGILDIFDRFNFTVKEDEPLEKEVAIDPELLGKLYEKFNAITPSNFYEYKKALASGKKQLEKDFNKKFGVYYTPREIVHYMCQQSLIYYLATELEGKVSKEDIEKLIKEGEHFTENEAVVLEKGKETKTYRFQLPKNIRENANLLDEKLRDIKICDPAVGSGAFPVGMMHEIIKVRNLLSIYTGQSKSMYELKRECIENSLYGVDIDAGACEIAKLRFWLSLIVDEEDFHNIRPLPNLDYKVVCGNSLLGFPEEWKSEISEKIENLKKEYFKETNSTRKKELKEEIDKNIKWRLENSDKSFGYRIDFDFRLFFSEVFHQKGGFDIVIANPPYGNLLKGNEKKFIENNYKYSTLSDISSPFIEKGFNLLKDQGELVFIITYAITFNKDFSKSRNLISNGFKESYIFTFDRDRCRIFESMTQTVSILKCFNKNSSDKKGIFTSRMFRETPDINKIEATNCNKYLMPKTSTYNQKHRLPKIGEEINRHILEKLLQFNNLIINVIKNTGCKIWIRTSGNYWYNAFDRKPYNSVEISPLYVDKNYANFIILLMNSSLFYFWFRIYGDGRHMNMDILECFPLPHREKILRYNNFINKAKERFMDKLFSVFERERNRFITSNVKSEIDLLDLILGKYFYNLGYNEITHILNYDSEIRGGNKLEKPFYEFLDKILSIIKDTDYLNNPTKQSKVRQYEKQIDELVYKLYDLTPEEIKIVEGDKGK